MCTPLLYTLKLGNETLNWSLTVFIGLLLIGIGLYHIIKFLSDVGTHGGKCRKALGRLTADFMAGATIGSLIQLTSIGGGSMLIPYLMKIMDNPRMMVGTDLIFGLAATVIASILHFGLGTINYSISLMLILGSLLGIYLRVALTGNLKKKNLQTLIALSLMVIGMLLVGETLT